jgi:hypothetical protein
MITLEQYFGPWADSDDATDERRANAAALLAAAGQLEITARNDGVPFPTNPATNSGVSGQRYGGFRPQACVIGAASSAHKQGLAVDLFDPSGAIDEWCLANLDKLEDCGIYIEAPDSTKGWSHWSTRAPRSGNRVFIP